MDPQSESQRPLLIPEGFVFKVKTKRGLESFRRNKVLDSGGSGTVYSFDSLDCGRSVIAKAPRYWGKSSVSLEIEERILGAFDHPNIVRLEGSIIDPYGHRILFFEPLSQNPLLAFNAALKRAPSELRRPGKAKYQPLPPPIAANLGLELLKAIEHLHASQLVHLDIKLNNFMIRLAHDDRALSPGDYLLILLENSWRGVLIDAGATRSFDYLESLNGRAEQGGIVVPELTPILAPPEVLVEQRRADDSIGLNWTPSIDLYQAAFVLYASLTGHVPYSHLNSQFDMGSFGAICDLKRAERRGMMSPFDMRVIQSLEIPSYCSFTKAHEHAREQWNNALYKLLKRRVAANPEERGDAESFRREFEALFQFKRVRRVSTGSLDSMREQNRSALSADQSLFAVNGRQLLKALSAAAGTPSEMRIGESSAPERKIEQKPPITGRLERKRDFWGDMQSQ